MSFSGGRKLIDQKGMFVLLLSAFQSRAIAKVRPNDVTITRRPGFGEAIERNKGTMAGSGDLWVHCFTCCLTQQGPRARNGRQRSHQRLRLDPSMIGVPTNFRHTAHISSGDLDMTSAQLSNIQSQMQMKGGYDNAYGVKAC